MNDPTQIGIHDRLVKGDRSSADLVEARVSVRASPNSYLIALLHGCYFSALLLYLEYNAAGIVLVFLSWILVPVLALTDRVVFDGKRLSRSGLVPRIWARLSGGRRSLRLNDIEQIETSAIRALNRGGNVIYRYRTAVRGKGLQIAFASGGEDYRRMVASVLPRVADNVLDARSIELRDHLADPRETLIKASSECIPSAEVLKNATRGIRTTALIEARDVEAAEETRAENLRDLGNQLRLNGYLRQAIEAFRRALVIKPHDGRILFDLARCLQSFAGAEHSSRLERKAVAALRLAEMRANDDADLLERLGEAYFQAGEWRRAQGAFQKALDRVGEGFRSARGLAEIALREGKLAHVIHHFSTANRLAQTPSLRRWTRGEADYFARLNNDDEYMELEVGRVSMLETFESVKRTALRLTTFGVPIILFGIVVEDKLIADSGWALTAVTLILWTGLNVGVRMFSARIPYEEFAPSED